MGNLNVATPLSARTKSISEESRYLDPHAKKNVRIIWGAFRYYVQLRKVHSYVSEHPHESLTLHKAAGIAVMARNYFAAFFHRKTGVTFKYWIDSRRVNRAAVLLRNSDLSISDVASDCGFADTTTFTRTFRRIRGITPRAFRECCMPGKPKK